MPISTRGDYENNVKEHLLSIKETLTDFEKQIWSAAFGAAVVENAASPKARADRAVFHFREYNLPRDGNMRIK